MAGAGGSVKSFAGPGKVRYPDGVIVWLNGQLVAAADARVSVFDRGFIFGDGVYEGLRAVPADGPRGGRAGARIVGLELHERRLAEGLAAAGIPFEAQRIAGICDALLDANSLRDAFVYVQVTRGVPRPGEPVRSRVPAGGAAAMKPTVFAYCSPQPTLDEVERAGPSSRSARVVEDVRWSMGRLKSISLMGNVLGSLEAAEIGADEAVFIRDIAGRRRVSEGLATNTLLALSRPGAAPEVVTPALESAPMLAGITRAIVLRENPTIVERPVMEAELALASEIIMVGTTTMVASITRLDDRVVGDGRPGPVARRLFDSLIGAIRRGA